MGTVKSKAKMLYAYVITVIKEGKMDILLLDIFSLFLAYFIYTVV